MKLGILTALLLACSMPLAQEAIAQQAVDVAVEPHYHLILQNDQVRVSALTLHRDESAFVRFQHSFLTVTLQDGEIVMWDEGKSPVAHFQTHKSQASFVFLTNDQQAKGVAGGFLNDRPNDYRNITVEFLDPNVGWNLLPAGTIGPPASMFLGGAVVDNVLLQPGDSFPAPEKPGAELVIPVSDVDLKGAGGIRIRRSPGDVAWISVNLTSNLTNAGREPAGFIVVQFTPDHP